MPELSYFAKRLKEEREKAGISMRTLAKRAGTTPQMVSYLESDRYEPGWRTVQQLAIALGITTDSLRDPAIKKVEAESPKRGRRPGKAPAPPPAKPARSRKSAS